MWCHKYDKSIYILLKNSPEVRKAKKKASWVRSELRRDHHPKPGLWCEIAPISCVRKSAIPRQKQRQEKGQIRLCANPCSATRVPERPRRFGVTPALELLLLPPRLSLPCLRPPKFCTRRRAKADNWKEYINQLRILKPTKRKFCAATSRFTYLCCTRER